MSITLVDDEIIKTKNRIKEIDTELIAISNEKNELENYLKGLNVVKKHDSLQQKENEEDRRRWENRKENRAHP